MASRDRRIARRKFMKVGTAAAAGLALTSDSSGYADAGTDKPVRVGVVGVGNRGTSLLRTLLAMRDVEIPAICDKIGRAHA